MWAKFTEAVKTMYDSLVRSYSPMIIGAILGWLATLLPVIPSEIEQGLIILLSLAFQMLWYFIARVIEIMKGHTSKMLTLGLTKATPVYGEVIAKPTLDTAIIDTTEASG